MTKDATSHSFRSVGEIKRQFLPKQTLAAERRRESLGSPLTSADLVRKASNGRKASSSDRP